MNRIYQGRVIKVEIHNPAHKRKFWMPHEMQFLGTVPDKKIAARLGCPVRTVTTKRLHLGIRAF